VEATKSEVVLGHNNNYLYQIIVDNKVFHYYLVFVFASFSV